MLLVLILGELLILIAYLIRISLILNKSDWQKPKYQNFKVSHRGTCMKSTVECCFTFNNFKVIIVIYKHMYSNVQTFKEIIIICLKSKSKYESKYSLSYCYGFQIIEPLPRVDHSEVSDCKCLIIYNSYGTLSIWPYIYTVCRCHSWKTVSDWDVGTEDGDRCE